MAEQSQRSKGRSQGLFNNYRYMCKKSMMLRALMSARATRRHQQKIIVANMKRKVTSTFSEPQEEQIKNNKSNTTEEERGHSDLADLRSSDPQGLGFAVRDSWEVDSGFCSEASPPASGRSSPCLSSTFNSTFTSTSVVALDCEMVGTGPEGRCSELARCSILDYHGNVLYDKYVRPNHPVTNYRTRWSGIRRHHLVNATPFDQAREEVLSILEGKVVVGHSIYHDFEALDIIHPAHMVRDTMATPLLRRLAGFPRERCVSLKILSNKLLSRRIQVGKRGHCSVEDARASLDLYRLVEVDWEQELQEKLHDDQQTPNAASSNLFMQDEYWPEDVTNDGK